MLLAALPTSLRSASGTAIFEVEKESVSEIRDERVILTCYPVTQNANYDQ
jgi:hypothetical protein